MTLSRLSLLALALLSINVVACGEKDDTGPEADTDTDADADTDTDTDTDPVNYFEPYLYSWGFEGGVVAGDMATLNSSHGELPPVFYFELYEKEYMNGYDDRYSCMIMYEAGASAGTNAPDAWFDFLFDLSTPYYTDCENLDPNVWGSDPYAIFSGYSWELTVEAIGQELIDVFIDELGEQKWADEYEPYVFGTQTYLDGSAIHTQQTMWGVAWSVEDGNLGEELLEIEDIAMGADGYYRLLPFYLWYVQ